MPGLKLLISKTGAGMTASPIASGVASPAPPPAHATPPSAGATPPARSAVVAAAGQRVIKAPNLGSFWRQPKPGAPPYVELGQTVDEDTTVCLIEVMKLFTPVKAGMKGRIADVCVQDGEMVEYDAPLFVLDPV